VYLLRVTRTTANRNRVKAAVVDQPIEAPVSERQGQHITLLDGAVQVRLRKAAAGGYHRARREVDARSSEPGTGEIQDIRTGSAPHVQNLHPSREEPRIDG
jgi:hypothetical protein